MSFIALKGINDVREPTYAQEGRYPLVIIDATMHKKEDSDSESIRCILEVESNDPKVKYSNVFHYIALPNGKDESKDQIKMLMAKRFFHQFGIDCDNGVELEAFVGSRAEGNLGLDTYEAPGKQPVTRNVLKLNPLPHEA